MGKFTIVGINLRVGVYGDEVCVNLEHLSAQHVAQRWANHSHRVVHTWEQ